MASPSSLPILPPVDEPAGLNDNYILYWNNVALNLLRITVTLGGPLTGPPASARALGMVHLAINDAYFGITNDKKGDTYLSKDPKAPTDQQLPPVDDATVPKEAVSAAAVTVLKNLYATPSASIATATTLQLGQYIQNSIAAFGDLNSLGASYQFGVAVGKAIINLLGIKPGEPGFDQGNYSPEKGPYKFDDDPTNPIRIVPVDVNNPTGPQKAVHVYNAPFYGMSAKRLAVHHVVDGVADWHVLGDPPAGFGTPDPIEYAGAFTNVHAYGGSPNLPSTLRTPTETAIGYFWAYDGSNLLGTPLRLYNQILRKLAWNLRPDKSSNVNSAANCADFARVFAIVNACMADAGIFAWQEKYCFQFWRPLTGVREDPGKEVLVDGVDMAKADPFWLTLGAPETNNNLISFKPPFPSYPSGHATFGGAGFQAMRLYYNGRNGTTWAPDAPDNLSFSIVSDELNGINRDLREPYNPLVPIDQQLGTVRTRLVRTFPSLWEAMFENALSRVFLGVHWRFDAFATPDVALDATTAQQGQPKFKNIQDVRYVTRRERSDVPTVVNGKKLTFPVGGVPLGIGIANDIIQSGLKPTPAALQPSGRYMCGDLVQAAKDAAKGTGNTVPLDAETAAETNGISVTSKINKSALNGANGGEVVKL